MSDQQLLNDLYATAARNEKDVITWRHHLHQHPELSNRETKTAAYIVERLKDMGFADTDIQQNIGGTGIIATLRGSTPQKRLFSYGRTWTACLSKKKPACPMPLKK